LRLRLFSKFEFPKEHGARRNALLRWAMIGSAVSKVSGLALQAVSIPLVYHSLGQHRFALYLLLTAALGTITLAQMGAGPGLIQGIAAANALGKRDQETSLLNAAFRFTGLAALIGGVVIISIIHLVPIDRLFGAAFAHDRVETVSAANVCIVILIALMVSGVGDSALAGYQEQVFSFIGSLVANIASMSLLFFVCRHTPTLIDIILVLYGMPTLARVANLFALFRRRPYLLLGAFRSCRGFYATLFSVGLAFWTIEISGMIEQYSGTFILARLSSTHDTDLFAIVFKYLALASMAVNVITQPLWPAIADAIAHRDIDWIHRSYARIRHLLNIYSGLLAVLSISAGPWIFRHILHVDTTGYYALFLILGLFALAHIRVHLLCVTMMGVQSTWAVAAVLFSENSLMAVFGVVLVPHLGAAGMALAYLIANVALPLWLLPRLMKRALQRISGGTQLAVEAC
jgi:O-antigen/teichoic acid export membrane protein